MRAGLLWHKTETYGREKERTSAVEKHYIIMAYMYNNKNNSVCILQLKNLLLVYLHKFCVHSSYKKFTYNTGWLNKLILNCELSKSPQLQIDKYCEKQKKHHLNLSRSKKTKRNYSERWKSPPRGAESGKGNT